jgi:hypothetical protein
MGTLVAFLLMVESTVMITALPVSWSPIARVAGQIVQLFHAFVFHADLDVASVTCGQPSLLDRWLPVTVNEAESFVLSRIGASLVTLLRILPFLLYAMCDNSRERQESCLNAPAWPWNWECWCCRKRIGPVTYPTLLPSQRIANFTLFVLLTAMAPLGRAFLEATVCFTVRQCARWIDGDSQCLYRYLYRRTTRECGGS